MVTSHCHLWPGCCLCRSPVLWFQPPEAPPPAVSLPALHRSADWRRGQRSPPHCPDWGHISSKAQWLNHEYIYNNLISYSITQSINQLVNNTGSAANWSVNHLAKMWLIKYLTWRIKSERTWRGAWARYDCTLRIPVHQSEARLWSGNFPQKHVVHYCFIYLINQQTSVCFALCGWWYFARSFHHKSQALMVCTLIRTVSEQYWWAFSMFMWMLTQL